MSAAPAIGIDLGTTHSRVAVFRDGKVETIPSDHGSPSMPSTVGYTRLKSDMYVKVPGDRESYRCERVVGEEAVEQDDKDAYNRVFSIKRLMGRTFDDTVQSETKYWPFKVCKSSVDEKPAPFREPIFYSPEYVDDGRPPKPKIKVCFNYGRRSFYYAEEISAMLLEKIKEAAGIYLGGRPVTNAVISVPACFNDAQRQATLDRATIAGLNVLGLINDPTAVAIQYYREKKPSGPRKVLIFDLGGGTCDVSIFVIDRHRIEVKSTAGDSHLGGDDFVNNTMESVMDEVDKIEVHKCTRKPYSYLDQIRKGCENAMHVLSESNVDQVAVFVRHKYHAFKHTATVTRERFESLNRPLLDRIEALVSSALEGAGLHHSNIDDVVLVGRSSNIQIIRRFFKEKFTEKEPVELTDSTTAVAFGAAIMAAKLQGDPSLRDFQVFDVLSRSLSYETSNGEVRTVARRNEPIPIRKCMPFKFRSDKKVHNLNVYEDDGTGNAPESKRLLGKFELTGIIPVSTVESFTVHPEIQVHFSIDMNGVLDVSASTYGKEFQVTADKGSFRRDELDILKNYLDTWLSEEDEVKIRNCSKYSLEAFINNSMSKVSYDIDDKKSQMTTGEKEEIQKRCREAQKWFDENQENADTKEFKRMLRQLSHFCQPIFDKYEIDQWPLYANPKNLQMERSSRAARELDQLSDQGVAVEPESATNDKQKLLCGSLEKKAGSSKQKTESPKQKTERLKRKTESPKQKTSSKLNVGTSPQILDLETGSTSSKSKPETSKDKTVSTNKEQESPEKKSEDGVTRLKSNKIHPKRSQTQVDSSNKNII